MPRMSSSPFSFPAFTGATRQLILVNLGAYFALALGGLFSVTATAQLAMQLAFSPGDFLHGALWQPFTYSLMHFGILGTLFELMSLWFLAGFLENFHHASWVIGLYAVSVLGTVAAALAIYACSATFGASLATVPLYGCFGGVFGMLAAIGVLYGDTEFLMMFIIGIKAKYLVMVYGLVAVAMLFGEQKLYAFAQLGGAVAGLLFVKFAPRRGVTFMVSEYLYGLRNKYYRWKRHRAARKFEVYMRKQGRTVKFDAQGRQIDGDDHDDKKRWN